jgi:PTH1 family peptidyl-tRNA hydrolase
MIFSFVPFAIIMILIAGLGNPGIQYAETRHNIGWMVLDELARRHGIPIIKSQLEALTGSGLIGEQKVLLVKPLTFMNASGRAVVALAKYYQIEIEDILIICDDLNLDLGRLRLRGSGSDGGNNGLKSVVASLKTKDYARLRCGVGQPSTEERQQRGTVDFVLSKFSPDEAGALQEEIERAADCVAAFCEQGTATAMNRFNG